jgi:endoribonuclease Dicer
VTKGKNEFWLELEAPKVHHLKVIVDDEVLSDIVEAIMGAMFLDSGFDMSVIDAFFERHFAEFFDTDDPPTIQRHPMVLPRWCMLTTVRAL